MAIIKRESVQPAPMKTRAIKRKALNQRATRGKRMRTGKGWRLTSPSEHEFKVTLVRRLKVGDEVIAICRVLPNPETK
jgi:hypothetical protein